MAKDPYKLLGVSRDADESAIRSAYRKLAKKYHPDVNSGAAAGEKFKEITAAYNLLSNPQLKAQYDSGRVDANGQQSSHGGFGGGFGGGGNPFGRTGGAGGDMNDMLESLFGMQMGAGSPFGGGPAFRGGAAQHRPKNGANIRYRVKISFFEAWAGLSKTIKPKSGAALSVTIPPGVESGHKITLKGRGKPGQFGGTAGNAIVEVNVEPHKYFRINGNKTYLDLPVTLHEALSAEKIRLKLPQGAMNITLPTGERLGQKLRLRGKGVKGGDLIIQPIIQLDSMTANALAAVKLPTGEQISRDIREKLFI